MHAHGVFEAGLAYRIARLSLRTSQLRRKSNLQQYFVSESRVLLDSGESDILYARTATQISGISRQGYNTSLL